MSGKNLFLLFTFNFEGFKTKWNLRHVQLPVVNTKECIEAYKNRKDNDFPVTPHKNICAGGEEGGNK